MVKQVSVLGLTLLVTVACGEPMQVVPPSEATELVNGMSSLASPAQVKGRREFAATRWVVIEDSKTRKPSKAGRFDDYVILASDYRVGSVSGKLRLEFLNSQLMSSWFYPADYETCLKEIAATGISFPRGGQPVTSRGNTTIRLGKDYEGHRYIAWEDSRLIEEMNRWLLKNS